MSTEKRGYILLHRSIFDNPHYFSDEFCKQMAWVDLLLIANHKESSYFIRGNEVKVPRGGIAYSMDTLAQRWRWSRNKVKRFLTSLKTNQQVNLQKTPCITLIIIINYNKYQTIRTAKHTTDGRQTDGRRTYTKNDKELNKSAAPISTENGLAPIKFIKP